jgi:hypothetical protein
MKKSIEPSDMAPEAYANHPSAPLAIDTVYTHIQYTIAVPSMTAIDSPQKKPLSTEHQGCHYRSKRAGSGSGSGSGSTFTSQLLQKDEGGDYCLRHDTSELL